MKHSILTFSLIAAAMTVHANTPLELSGYQCRVMAVESSEDVQRAENSMETARLDVGVAKTGYLPKLDGNVTAVYSPINYDLGDLQLITKGTYMAGLSLTQPIYTGGRISAGNKLAKIGAKASEEQYRMTRMQTISDADNAYWTYVAVLQKVKMVEAYMSQMDTLYQAMDMRRLKGFLTKADMLRVEAKKSEIEYQLQKCLNGADLCRMALCRVIGVPFDTEIVPTDTVIVVERIDMYDYSITDRPEFQLLNLNVEASHHKVGLVRGDFLPSVGLSIAYTHYGNIRLKGNMPMQDGNSVYINENIFSNGLNAMLGVKIPLFHWGEGIKKVKKARIEETNARLELEKNTRLIDLEIRQAINNLSSGYAMIETADVALRQAEANLEAVRERFSVNKVTITDVLDAESQWQQSYSNQIEARAQYRIYLTDYRRATGTLTENSDI
ncbi:MAG: TolC family protein [Bacteroidales bacterium]|nr:TolC family protein [Bacteroidales bacterium]